MCKYSLLLLNTLYEVVAHEKLDGPRQLVLAVSNGCFSMQHLFNLFREWVVTASACSSLNSPYRDMEFEAAITIVLISSSRKLTLSRNAISLAHKSAASTSHCWWPLLISGSPSYSPFSKEIELTTSMGAEGYFSSSSPSYISSLTRWKVVLLNVETTSKGEKKELWACHTSSFFQCSWLCRTKWSNDFNNNLMNSGNQHNH